MSTAMPLGCLFAAEVYLVTTVVDIYLVFEIFVRWGPCLWPRCIPVSSARSSRGGYVTPLFGDSVLDMMAFRAKNYPVAPLNISV